MTTHKYIGIMGSCAGLLWLALAAGAQAPQAAVQAPPPAAQQKAASAPAPAVPAPAAPPAAAPEEIAALQRLNALYDNKATPGDTLDAAIHDFQLRYPKSRYLAGVAVLGVRYNDAHGNYLKVLDYGEQALKLAPTDLYVLSLLGSRIPANIKPTDLDQEQRLAEAEADDERVITLAGSIATTGASLNGHAIAPEVMQRAKDAAMRTAYSSLGRIGSMRHQPEAAVAAYQKAAALTPANPSDLYYLAQAQSELRQFAAASASLVKAAALAPNSAPFQKLIAAEQAKIKAAQAAGN